MPFRVLREAVPPDERVFLFGRRLVLASRVAVVADESAGLHETLSAIERSLVELHSHDRTILVGVPWAGARTMPTLSALHPTQTGSKLLRV
jgi:hypothetical protein